MKQRLIGWATALAFVLTIVP
ncbi:MAG: hypothetical protein QOG73_3063, partial [Acetobacteraceae bacterium]|nr:hypothetical protein [Acetobacteraceae bacterium]